MGLLANCVIGAGHRQDIQVAIPKGDTDPETFIPVTVIRGASAGPTLLMVAGVHGFEFAPILAAQQLADEIDPNNLSGTVIIVRLAHLAAFQARSIHVNPFDRKNLNRSFPGKATGTQTERIAHALSSEIIPAADIVLDLHSGDGAEWLDAFVGVYGGPLATDYPKALAIAEAIGFPNIVRYSINTREELDAAMDESDRRQRESRGTP